MSEIRGFYALQTKFPLSATAQALWHYLMYRANSVWWAMPLMVRNEEVQGALGITPAVFRRAREELVAGKFLMVEPQGGRRPSQCFLLSCVRPGRVVAPSMSAKGFAGKEAGEKAGKEG